MQLHLETILYFSNCEKLPEVGSVLKHNYKLSHGIAG